MTLSEMKRFLAAHDIHLTKSLGQNFLHDGNQLRRIAAAADLRASDRVLEIGPGLGPLTELLLAEAGQVLAIEKDARLTALLADRFGVAVERLPASASRLGLPSQPGLRLVLADALEFLREATHDWSDWKLVSNLPYSVASPILVELARSPAPPALMVATLQLEVAQRLAAAAGRPEYGLLTLLVQLRFEPRGWFRISRTCFHPTPEVDSACLLLERRAKPLLETGCHETFDRLARLGFSQRRKMMLKLLKAAWPLPLLERAFAETGVSTRARAESVSLEQFTQLARLLAPPLR